MPYKSLLEEVRQEVLKYLDNPVDDDAPLEELLLSDDISAIILSLEQKLAVKPERSIYISASSISDLAWIFDREITKAHRLG